MAQPTTTAATIFEQAIMLMDEQSDMGQAVWADTAEYQNRTPAILNVLLGECFPSSDTYTVEGGKRPVAKPVVALTDVVCVDDVLARTVLPYGLAAELVKNDDPALGGYFLQRYQELLLRCGRNLPVEWKTIEDVYGVAGHSSFARW